jgi:hypothetical protein
MMEITEWTVVVILDFNVGRIMWPNRSAAVEEKNNCNHCKHQTHVLYK